MQQSAGAAPYPPSFLDRFMTFIRRLPGPHGPTYLLLFILQSTLVHVVAWATGWRPAFTFIPIALVFPLWLWAPLAIMTYLNSVSREALAGFSPLLDLEQGKLKRLEHEFTVMPARPVILSGLFWLVIYALLTVVTFEAFYVAYGLGTLLSAVFIAEGLVSFLTGSAIYYHSLRQLRLVNLTVRMAAHFDLFRLDPVYAFSRLTSRIGVSWMVMLSLTLLLFPIQLAKGPILAVLALQVVLAIAAFVLPLWFVNRRLVAEKRRLQAEHNRRVESTLRRLHRCLDGEDLGEAEQLDHAMTALDAERDVLAGIPTWPWRTATLTGFLSAIVLPIALFLIQFLVERLLGG